MGTEIASDIRDLLNRLGLTPNYLGSYGNAANTVVFPLAVIALAMAVIIGDGCCAFVSISLGKSNSDDASYSTGNAVVWQVLPQRDL